MRAARAEPGAGRVLVAVVAGRDAAATGAATPVGGLLATAAARALPLGPGRRATAPSCRSTPCVVTVRAFGLPGDAGGRTWRTPG